MNDIYSTLLIPEERRLTAINKEEGEFIYNFLKDKKPKITLEVGLAFGFSAVYIMSATDSTHYVIDAFQEKYDNLGLKNVENNGFSNRLRFENDFSHNALPKLLKENVKLDFAFIDGGHKFDEIFIDFYYIDLLLNEKAYVLFHDAWMRSTQNVLAWIKNNKKNYRFIEVPVKNLILLKKIGSEDREWDHFKPFSFSRSWYLRRQVMRFLRPPLFFIDKQIGRLGLYVKKTNPSLYKLIHLKKDE